MGLSLSHILLVLVIILIVFGAGKLPKVMGDLAKGFKAFKKGLAEEENDSHEDIILTPPKRVSSVSRKKSSLKDPHL